MQAKGVKWFGEGEAKTKALRDVNLEAHFGEMVYIVGPPEAAKPRCSAFFPASSGRIAGSVSVEGVGHLEALDSTILLTSG